MQPHRKYEMVLKMYGNIVYLCLILCQGVGKTTLAKKIADSWKCILIDGKHLHHQPLLLLNSDISD